MNATIKKFWIDKGFIFSTKNVLTSIWAKNTSDLLILIAKCKFNKPDEIVCYVYNGKEYSEEAMLRLINVEIS